MNDKISLEVYEITHPLLYKTSNLFAEQDSEIVTDIYFIVVLNKMSSGFHQQNNLCATYILLITGFKPNNKYLME
jgi:hypothetical protein